MVGNCVAPSRFRPQCGDEAGERARGAAFDKGGAERVTRLYLRDAGRLTILADPNAAAFYERAGAVRIGEAPSDSVPGRLLPLYEVRLDSTGDRDLEPHLCGRSKR